MPGVGAEVGANGPALLGGQAGAVHREVEVLSHLGAKGTKNNCQVILYMERFVKVEAALFMLLLHFLAMCGYGCGQSLS